MPNASVAANRTLLPAAAAAFDDASPRSSLAAILCASAIASILD